MRPQALASPHPYLQILKKELVPALGCTEPAAVAYAAAKARSVLDSQPSRVSVEVSRNIFKNAMGVGIPGTEWVGLEIAAALGALAGDARQGLEVLRSVDASSAEEAQRFVLEKRVQVQIFPQDIKFYIAATVWGKEGRARVIIQDSHTNIIEMEKNSQILYHKEENFKQPAETGTDPSALSLEGIYAFISQTDAEELAFLQQAVELNETIAEEGLQHPYGLQVGKSIYESSRLGNTETSPADYAVALTCAAADARMSGAKIPVMTSCGSGNQGITATLPVIALARRLSLSRESLYKGLAMSCLVTIHVKSFLGRLSSLCGCGVAASIGSCCAVTYLLGGTLQQIRRAVQNMVADVSGMICDGAKAGCSLKIATAVTSAYRNAYLALRDLGAASSDGIVCEDVEETIRNLGILGTEGMAETDRVILSMMAPSKSL